ncbi:MAG: hypothetical protein ACSHWW_09590 [Nonlabens sp.]|uniref:hypothetical protein n=1 Tax=Nonlabens sp. TaxID=1888209 RepID=UPI003EF9EAC2
MELLTLRELAKWMKANNYAFDNYSINGNFIHEGYGIEKNGELFQWYYTERGEKQTLEYFRTEFEAVQYALSKIIGD